MSLRLWVAGLDLPVELHAYLSVYGRPITYGPQLLPLEVYQTIFGREPGSAEMPSAARAFSHELVTSLAVAGVGIAPLLLHTGVSSPESHEPPYEEYYRVDRLTARRVNETRAGGGRVIAVGTTVVRALETVVDDTGTVHPGRGFTDVVVSPERRPLAIDGLLTGFHEPRSSHLQMLEAIAGGHVLETSYRRALDEGYLWHEFGDLHLLVP